MTCVCLTNTYILDISSLSPVKLFKLKKIKVTFWFYILCIYLECFLKFGLLI